MEHSSERLEEPLQRSAGGPLDCAARSEKRGAVGSAPLKDEFPWNVTSGVLCAQSSAPRTVPRAVWKSQSGLPFGVFASPSTSAADACQISWATPPVCAKSSATTS